MAQAVKEKVDDSSQFIDWEKRTDIRAQLKVQIILTLAKFKYPPATRDEVFKAILEQAENFMKNRDANKENSTDVSKRYLYPTMEENDLPVAAAPKTEYRGNSQSDHDK